MDFLLREIGMNSEAECLMCCRPRLLKALVPVARGYGLKLYKCADCGSSLWLVTSVPEILLSKQRREYALRLKGAAAIDMAIRECTVH
jgi:hypothetical protein